MKIFFRKIAPLFNENKGNASSFALILELDWLKAAEISGEIQEFQSWLKENFEKFWHRPLGTFRHWPLGFFYFLMDPDNPRDLQDFSGWINSPDISSFPTFFSNSRRPVSTFWTFSTIF